MILSFAQNKTDGWLVIRMPKQVVYSGEIEIQLACVRGFEGPHLEINDDEASELEVIEQEIDFEIFATHFQRILAADKREADAELQEKLPDVFEETALKIFLVSFRREG